jgi:hypothetical protein
MDHRGNRVNPQPSVDPTRCPLCGQRNDCCMTGSARSETCWCMHLEFGEALLARVPIAAQARACICRRCAVAGTAQPGSTD